MISQDYEAAWRQRVAPYLAEHATQGSLAGAAGVTLRYLSVERPDPAAAVVLVGGHAESFHKYAELCYDLRELDVSIHALDPRGQGSSGRLLADPEKSHVESWRDYVADLRQFVDTVVRVRSPPRRIALGHSLGGGIVAAYLEERPGDFDGAILSAPLVRHAVGGPAMALLAALEPFARRSYVPGGGPFRATAFEVNRETHSRARHERKFRDCAEHPEIRMGHPTVHFMNETRRMAARALAGAGDIDVRLLVFQAAEDVYVDARAIESFCARARHCRRVVLEGARHELLIEADAIRDRVLAEIRGFIGGRS